MSRISQSIRKRTVQQRAEEAQEDPRRTQSTGSPVPAKTGFACRTTRPVSNTPTLIATPKRHRSRLHEMFGNANAGGFSQEDSGEKDEKSRTRNRTHRNDKINPEDGSAAVISKTTQGAAISTARKSPAMATDCLILSDVQAWRAWLDCNEGEQVGTWLVLAKKGTTSPTSLTNAQALEEALCSGWIDGQCKSRDDTTFLKRFTPRRRASLWSQRNVGIAQELIAQGRMRPRGHLEIERAREDGRWERAYYGPSKASVPMDLQEALDARPLARERFNSLSSPQRYPYLFRLMTVSSATRQKHIEKTIDFLLSGQEGVPLLGSSTISGRATTDPTIKDK